MANADPPPKNNSADADLLRRFWVKRDEAAFRLLVERHGPLVLGVCRRNAFSPEDADDAFQATFMVLSQSARSIRKSGSLSAWLYGVAMRVSARVRRGSPAHGAQALEDAMAQTHDPLDELLARHDGMIADEELSALPENLRAPLVLRYLAGKNNQATAAELGISVAALEGRLKRGKSLLRARLLRRGVTLTAVVATLKATQVAAGGLPEALVASTAGLGCQAAAGSLGATASNTPNLVNIAFEESRLMNTFLLPKLLVPFGAAGVAVLALGVHLAYSQAPSDGGRALKLRSAVEEAVSADPQTSTTTIAAGPTEGPLAGEGVQFSQLEVSQVNGTLELADTLVPNVIDAKPRTQIERQIELALGQPRGEIQFEKDALNQVVDYLRADSEIPIVLDTVAMEELGLSADDPVTTRLPSGLRLGSVLRHLLGPLELEAIVKDEVLFITTRERAETLDEPRVYPMRNIGVDADTLRELLIKTVQPHTWSETGGGTAAIEVLPAGDLLIRQTYAGHREIALVLTQLRGSQTSQADRQPTRDSAAPSTVAGPVKPVAPPLAARQIELLRDRYAKLEESIQRKQAEYKARALHAGSVLSPRNAAQNDLDRELLIRLRGELLEVRRNEATGNTSYGDYRDELAAEIAELTESVLNRSESDSALLRRGEELDQLKRIANDLLEQIIELETKLELERNSKPPAE